MDKISILSQSPLFEMLSNAELEAMAELAPVRRYTAGQVIFEEGELGDSLYVIVSGEVEVLTHDRQGQTRLLTLLTLHDFFGEMSVIDKVHRSATTRARTDAELLQLTAENLTGFRKDHPDGFTFIVINIARALSARLRDVNARLTTHL
jgi:CRP/FNR family cyclic AMP-dependent transcriptional regulator